MISIPKTGQNKLEISCNSLSGNELIGLGEVKFDILEDLPTY